MLKHLGHPKINCKKAYTEDELRGFELKSEIRRNQKKAQRKRIKYDKERKANEHKKYYKPDKRAKMYKEEKANSKNFNLEEEKAQKYEKEDFENALIRKNESFLKRANEYFSKCTDGVEHIHLSEDVIGCHQMLKANVKQIFDSL